MQSVFNVTKILLYVFLQEQKFPVMCDYTLREINKYWKGMGFARLYCFCGPCNMLSYSRASLQCTEQKNNKFFELKLHSHHGIFKETNGEKDNIVIALNLPWILLARNQASHSDTLLALSPCREKCSKVLVDKSEREFTHEREGGLGFSV